ncbi:uncharacterized protein LOC114803673 [Zeugodacus cucurbitae]|uniref:uncharacterized protein LOC114803673 n=1 Tax=Zeugodacus cucurbitae TaxID=28588 RepID=UPI0023D94C87|nr:uncharacterized protein LOC114803673 [Zeugodacus cucurbitae]
MDTDVVNSLKNLTIHSQLFKKNDANQFQPFIVNVKGNLCAIMDNKISSHYISIIKRILKSNTNVIHKCPYVGHLKASDLYFDSKFLPVIPPTGIYKVISIFNDGKSGDFVGKVIFQAEVREAQAKRV